MKIRKEKKRLGSIRTPEEAEKIMNETIDDGKKLVQNMINEVLKRGFDSKYIYITLLYFFYSP